MNHPTTLTTLVEIHQAEQRKQAAAWRAARAAGAGRVESRARRLAVVAPAFLFVATLVWLLV